MTLSTNVLQTQLDLYLTWVTTTYGNVETLMGLHMTKIILRLASRSSEMTEEFAAYEAFFGLQLAPNQKLKHYKDKYDVLMQDLLLARSGKPVDERLSLHFFLIKMSKSCRMEIEKQHTDIEESSPLQHAVNLGDNVSGIEETQEKNDINTEDTKEAMPSVLEEGVSEPATSSPSQKNGEVEEETTTGRPPLEGASLE